MSPPLLPHTNPHAVSLRSPITMLAAFTSSLDSHLLDATGVRRIFSTVVEHTIARSKSVATPPGPSAIAHRVLHPRPGRALCSSPRRANQRRPSTVFKSVPHIAGVRPSLSSELDDIDWTKGESARVMYSRQSLQAHHQNKTPNLHRTGSAS